MARKAAEAEPAEDIPANKPVGQGNLGFRQGAEGVVVSSTARIRAVRQFTAQLQRALQREDAMEAMIANVETTLTERTGLLFDSKRDLDELRAIRPNVAHDGFCLWFYFCFS